MGLIVGGHAASVRILVLVALALALPAVALAATRTTDRGIIVAVRPQVIVLRELDGTRQRIRVSAATRVVIDGVPARLRDLRRGDVAYVVHFGLRPAVRIRAFTQ